MPVPIVPDDGDHDRLADGDPSPLRIVEQRRASLAVARTPVDGFVRHETARGPLYYAWVEREPDAPTAVNRGEAIVDTETATRIQLHVASDVPRDDLTAAGYAWHSEQWQDRDGPHGFNVYSLDAAKPLAALGPWMTTGAALVRALDVRPDRVLVVSGRPLSDELGFAPWPTGENLGYAWLRPPR